MKKKTLLSTGLALALGVASLSVQATVIDLYSYAFNIDNTFTEDAAPGGVDLSAFDTVTGLGSISFSISSLGDHFFGAFFDHEIDQDDNGYDNETGSTGGAAAVGQSWEIDEPGFGSWQNGTGGSQYYGDIFLNLQDSGAAASALDNLTFYDAVDDQSLTGPDDVSMAMGWNFNLAASETATITMVIGQDQPVSGFYLQQDDPGVVPQGGTLPENPTTIYLSGNLTIVGGVAGQVPEPQILLLVASGLLGMGVARRRGKAKQGKRMSPV